MKTLYLFFLSLTLVLSCNSDDDNLPLPPDEPVNELNASWYLTYFEPGFGINTAYTNEILWTFNADSTIDVVIQDGVDVNNGLLLNANGNYPYTIDGNEISLGVGTYFYEIIDEVLTIEDMIGQAADGRKLTFTKVE